MTDFQARRGQEGNRWFNERPDGDAVASWFAGAVDMPEGLKAEDYVGGVVLIPGKEKADEPLGFDDRGFPRWTEVENLVFTPYVKVETRVAFFHALMSKHCEEWEGVIEPVVPEDGMVKGLPPGFQRIALQKEEKVTPYLLCTMKVTVFKRGTVKWREYRNTRTGALEFKRTGETIIDAAPATKQVPTLRRFGPDDSVVMKAETGAIGRALGMAGMLIVPGTGIATAEDMREAIAERGIQPAAKEEGMPSPEGRAAKSATAELSHEELVTMGSGLVVRLREVNEAAHTAFLAWCHERGFKGSMSEMKDGDLKQVIKQAEKGLETAQGGGATEQAAAAGAGGQDG